MYRLVALSLLCVFAACSTQQKVISQTPRAAMRMDAPVPDSITTPSRVNTRIGTLKFFDGFPDKETVTKLYDNLDFMRGVETFLNGIPAASLEAMRQAHEGRRGRLPCSNHREADGLHAALSYR